jgi:hypothetical protein
VTNAGLAAFALTIGAAAALLAGCAGSQPLSANPTQGVSLTRERAAHSGSWMAPNTSGQNLIYMGIGDTVGVYTFAGKEVGVLKGFGFEGVAGLCSDSQGNVWIPYGDSLLEYAHGGTIPIAQVYTPSEPHGCSVDPTTGNLAVTEGDEQTDNNVLVYTNIYGVPQAYTDPDFFYYWHCSYDSQGNLFVNGLRGKKLPLAELPGGGSSLGTVTVDEKLEKLGDLQWDGQYLALSDSLAHVVYQLSVVNGKATTATKTHFEGWSRARFKTIESCVIYNGVIVLTFSDRQTGFWKFPAGGKSRLRISVVAGAKTVSVAPSALGLK